MARAPKTLNELFHDTLKDIYFAEKKILATLPKMAKAAKNGELKAAFEKHRDETEGQVERLDQVFAIIAKKPQGKTCAAIVGITEEGAEIMQDYKGSPALDAGLLAAAQARIGDRHVHEHLVIVRLFAKGETIGRERRVEVALPFKGERFREIVEALRLELALAPAGHEPAPPGHALGCRLRALGQEEEGHGDRCAGRCISR